MILRFLQLGTEPDPENGPLVDGLMALNVHPRDEMELYHVFRTLREALPVRSASWAWWREDGHCWLRLDTVSDPIESITIHVPPGIDGPQWFRDRNVPAAER